MRDSARMPPMPQGSELTVLAGEVRVQLGKGQPLTGGFIYPPLKVTSSQWIGRPQPFFLLSLSLSLTLFLPFSVGSYTFAIGFILFFFTVIGSVDNQGEDYCK